MITLDHSSYTGSFLVEFCRAGSWDTRYRQTTLATLRDHGFATFDGTTWFPTETGEAEAARIRACKEHDARLRNWPALCPAHVEVLEKLLAGEPVDVQPMRTTEMEGFIDWSREIGWHVTTAGQAALEIARGYEPPFFRRDNGHIR